MSREHHPGDSSIVLLNPSLESFSFFFLFFSFFFWRIFSYEYSYNER